MTEVRRRPRRLSESEIELWLSVAQTVVARKGAVLPRTKPVAPAPSPLPPAGISPPVDVAPPALPAPSHAQKRAPPLAPFEKRYRRQVTRGQVAIDAAIDLHGLNQADAHRELHAFLRAAHHGGDRLVLVVTGKGRPRRIVSPAAGAEPGVLRRAVPGWLRAEGLRAIVLGFEEAGLAHGGMGALYIRLRRRPS